MRITAHGCRYCEYQCDYDECKRSYCNKHRLIYTSCATELIEETEGDYDVIGGVRHFNYYTDDCPECHKEFESRQLKREMTLRAAKYN